MWYDYLFIGLFGLVIIVIRNLAMYFVATKKEKAILNAIKQLKRKVKEHPEQKGEIGATIYSLRFSNTAFAIKSLFVRYGVLVVSFIICKQLFSHISAYIWVYIGSLIVFNILYKRVVK